MHVLVIDDDPGVRFVLGAMVRRLGFSPLLAANGPEGLELLREHATQVACTLVDLTMPDWNGLETRERIRAELPGAPVLLMTGHAEDAPGATAGELLRKPFTSQELGAALAKGAALPPASAT